MMERNQLFALLNEIVVLGRLAGQSILEVYESEDIGLVYKEDDSPLTKADKKSNDVIEKGLKELTPDIPIISEETIAMTYEKRKDYEYIWIVDPLDGTKEFVNRNGEFCVNIALVYKGKAVLGVLDMPALNQTAYAAFDCGAFLEKGGMICRLNTSNFKYNASNPRLCVSKSHTNQRTKDYISQHFKNYEQISGGSATKFIHLCNGQSDIYPRLGTTMEWDIAAPQIILEEAGGSVINLETGQSLAYNKEDLKNPEFVAYANKSYHVITQK